MKSAHDIFRVIVLGILVTFLKPLFHVMILEFSAHMLTDGLMGVSVLEFS